MVQALKHIFTSPSFVDSDFLVDDDADEAASESSQPQSPRKRRKASNEKRTRANVAALLGMKSVSPQAIAYTAVQVCHL